MLHSSGFSSISIIYLKNRTVGGKGGRRAARIGVRAEVPAPTGADGDEEECVHTLFYAVFARAFAGIEIFFGNERDLTVPEAPVRGRCSAFLEKELSNFPEGWVLWLS